MPLLLLLFVCSGACGLAYQVLWLRQLSYVFGVTAYAASTVLAAFMAGLALGSWLAGPILARIRRPLRAFGIAELLVGAVRDCHTRGARPRRRLLPHALPRDARCLRRPDRGALRQRLRRADGPHRADGADPAAAERIVAGARPTVLGPHQCALRRQHGWRGHRRLAHRLRAHRLARHAAHVPDHRDRQHHRRSRRHRARPPAAGL